MSQQAAADMTRTNKSTYKMLEKCLPRTWLAVKFLQQKLAKYKNNRFGPPLTTQNNIM